MSGQVYRLLSLLVLVAIAGCAPATAPVRSGGGEAPGAASVQPPRTLSMIDSASNLNRISLALFSAELGSTDAQDVPFPVLAEALPQLNTDTWQVSADGRMETRYTLRPGLTWHDGTPLAAEDFVFGWRVQNARVDWGLNQQSEEGRQMEEVLAPDARTVLIRWRRPYAEAGMTSLAPRPRHILSTALEQGEAEAFGSHAYWTTSYVGVGPYRLVRWEPGAFIEGEAFPGYALGTPKINRVQVTWNGDPNVVATRLLSQAAHLALDSALQFQQAATLRRDWRDASRGSILLSPNQLRLLQVQSRPEFARPSALLDVRARRAMLHAIDRQALSEAILEGEGILADSLLPPTVGFAGEIDRAVTKYSFDVRRTEQLMGELGYRKGSDGFFTSPTDGRFNPEVRGVAEGQEGQETTIIADNFRKAGVDAALDMVPAAQRAQSDELKASFPGFTTNYNTLSRESGVGKLATARMANPANRWSGSNKSGWTHPEYDRLYDGWLTSLDLSERNRLLVQMMKVVSEELPLFPLYFNFEVVAHVADLRGPQTTAPGANRYGNLHEWHWAP
jgi:peptide/nickel transport system substrate-binding protein